MFSRLDFGKRYITFITNYFDNVGFIVNLFRSLPLETKDTEMLSFETCREKWSLQKHLTGDMVCKEIRSVAPV